MYFIYASCKKRSRMNGTHSGLVRRMAREERGDEDDEEKDLWR
jgi:hypothetical protein